MSQVAIFCLLDLPPEIWSRICRLIVTYDKPIQINEGMSRVSVCERVAQPPITRVSKLLRNETLPIFYGNQFIYSDHYAYIQTLI